MSPRASALDCRRKCTVINEKCERILSEHGAALARLRQQLRLAEGSAASTARTQAAEALKTYLQNSPPGRREGPSVMLGALARTDPGRAWLTQVAIGSAGVRLEGRALDPAAVLDYAARLETRAAGLGLEVGSRAGPGVGPGVGLIFRTVELNSVAPGQGVSFRLY